MTSPASTPASQSRAVPSGICVAVSGSSGPELLAHSAALLTEFPFQELRLDYLPDPPAALAALAEHIRSHPQGTFLATCRRQSSGGNFTGSPQAELNLLSEAARAGCRLLDLAIESAESLGAEAVQQLRNSGATVIVSWHDFTQTGDLTQAVDRMRPFAPDICKIVPTAATLHDNLALFSLLSKNRNIAGPQIVALCMGEAGVPSRLLGIRAGSAFTFAAQDDRQATAPGQICARTLRDLYRMADINSNTEIYGVAGSPIRSSMSPLMVNTAFAQRCRNAVYVPLLTDNPAELFEFAHTLPLHGISVTMPLKQTILPFLSRVDPLAARIGAVNTVRRTQNGTFEGFNSDAAGVVHPLELRLNLRGARVLVLGAGGAARAAVFGCADRGAHVSVLSRRPEQGVQLATQAAAVAITRDRLRSQGEFDVIINATPAGMHGNPARLPLDPEELRARLLFDLVYNPLHTPLLQAAEERGIETIPGLEMFVHQGAQQFELWTGQPAPVDIMREVVSNALTRSHGQQT